MIVEIRVNGVVRHLHQTNINANVNSGHSWQTQVDLREIEKKKIIATVWKDMVPNIKEQGKVEVFFIYQSNMAPEPEPVVPMPLSPAMVFQNTKPKPFTREKGVYDNINQNQFKNYDV